MLPARGFVNHQKTCYKHPGREWLHEQYTLNGHSMKKIAREIPLGSVSDDTVAKWLDAAGIPRRKYNKSTPRAKKPPVVVVLSAPIQGVSKCAKCWSLEYCGGLEAWEPVGCEGVLDWEFEFVGVRPG